MKFALEHSANSTNRKPLVSAINSQCSSARTRASQYNTDCATGWTRNVYNFCASEFECRTFENLNCYNFCYRFTRLATPNEFAFGIATDKSDTINLALSTFYFARRAGEIRWRCCTAIANN